jgi:hypothetical protein
VFENRVLRRIFGPKKDEVTGEWRRCTMRIFTFYTPPRISFGRSNQGERVGRDMWHAWESNVYRVFMGKPEEKIPLWRPRRRWE